VDFEESQVAQMIMSLFVPHRLRVIAGLVVALAGLPPTSQAQSAIPADALVAEGREDWAGALRLYEGILDREPKRWDLWLRVADIHARLGNSDAVFKTLTHAIEARPDDPELYARLSRACAEAGRPNAALAAIRGAVALRPNDPAYLKAMAELAAWSGDYAAARTAYETLLGLEPGNTGAVLNLARVSVWSGRTDQATTLYHRYLQAVPTDAEAWLETARSESWRGNDAGALSLLEQYRLRFAETDAYRRELASVLTRARRPRQALDVLRSIPDAQSSQPDLASIAALAHIEAGDQAAAARAVGLALATHTEPQQAESLMRQMRKAFGSVVQPSGTGYGDSDGLRSYRLPIMASYALAAAVRVEGGYERQELSARIGSGLERSDGGRDVGLDWVWAGTQVRPATGFRIRAAAGRLESNTSDEWTYLAGLSAAPVDGLTLHYEYEHTLLTVSPRAVSLGIARDLNRLRLAWQPSLDLAIDVDTSWEGLSDENERWAFRIGPRWGLLRNQYLNLDLGASAYLFGTRLDLDHGYYDPSLYEAYMVTVTPYFKLSENHGLSVFLEGGAQRDDSTTKFEPGGSAATELTMGIYQAWMLKVNASATFNARLASGAFRGFSSGIGLARRF
jgi:predicted Zn-dependent protease